MSETDVTLKKEGDLPKWRTTFLDALSAHGNVTQAAKTAKISRMTAYRERLADLDFAAAWDVAKGYGIDALEDEATRRALNGSDVLLMFRLKAERPKYRDKTPPGFTFTLEQLQSMTDDELDDLSAKLARLS